MGKSFKDRKDSYVGVDDRNDWKSKDNWKKIKRKLKAIEVESREDTDKEEN